MLEQGNCSREELNETMSTSAPRKALSEGHGSCRPLAACNKNLLRHHLLASPCSSVKGPCGVSGWFPAVRCLHRREAARATRALVCHDGRGATDSMGPGD